MDTGHEAGRNSFVQLSVRILTITPNAGGAERTFSQMGIVHTKLRNRLGSEKVHKTVAVKMDLKRQDREEGEVESEDARKRNLELFMSSLPLEPVEPSNSTRTGASSIQVATRPRTMPPAVPLTTPSDSAIEASLQDPEEPSEPEDNDEATADLDAAIADPDVAAASDFSILTASLIADAELDSRTNPASTSATRAAFESAVASLVTSDADSEISDANALLLKNMFNFEAAELTHGWMRGSHALQAEMEFNECLTTQM